MGDNLKLCMGCMNPIDDNPKCPVCGYYDGTPYLPSYLPPKTLLNDRYIVGKLLNYNGEGATYIGYDKVINKKVQIREFFPDTLCTRVPGSVLVSINPSKLVQYKNLMAEFSELHKSIMKMRTLSHICSVLEVFQQNNTTYVILEYIEGKTLKRYLQDHSGEISWQQVKTLFPPIFTTLSLIHNSGIIHRGISLDTIYYTDAGELKITGFSTPAARTSNSDIAPELFAGYAAPEQYSSNKWQGTWTDVYAISAVLYRVLTGCMPTESISRIGNDSLLEPSQINRNIPVSISKVIMSGMKLNSEMRIQTITELVTKLFEQQDFVEKSRVETTTVIIPKQTVQKKSKKPEEKDSIKSSRIYLYVMGATLVCAIIIAIFLIIFLSGDDKKDDSSGYNYMSSSEESSEESSLEDSSLESSVPDSSATSKPKILLGNLVGTSFEGLNELYTKNLKIIPIYEYNDSYAQGIIYEQDVEANTEIEAGSVVNVKVSKGPKNVQIPEFAGMTGKDYVDTLSKANIKYQIQEVESNEVDAGFVVDISRTGYIDITKNETITVYVSKGPSPTNNQP